MARYFLDSSALVKRYHQESGTAEVEERLFNEPANRFFVSRLALVELHSCFARLVCEGTLSKSDFAKLTARFEEDVASGVLLVAAVSSRRLEGAASLLATQGLTQPLRTLDAIHLATARALDGRSRITAFVAADQKLIAAAANGGGLAVLNLG